MLDHGFTAPRKPKRVLIIGAAGFVGRTIAARLKQAEVETVGLTRSEIDLMEGGAADKLTKWLRPDDSVVFISAKAPAKTPPMLVDNLRMAGPIWAALNERPVSHLVYISSDAIYVDNAQPVSETSYAAPSTTHGMMHAARELMLRTLPVPFATLRPTLIYGLDDPHGGYGPNRFRREAEAGGPIRIFGEGEERRDHVAVEDVASLAYLVLMHRSRGALNAVTGISTPFREIAERLARLFGVKVESLARQGPPPHLLHRHFDVSAVHKSFPDFHFTALDEGLQHLRHRTRPAWRA